mgnify:CR=1 FL=1
MTWITRTDPSGWQTRWNEHRAAQWLARGQWTRATLRDTARARLAEDPGKVMLIEGEHSLTRATCHDQALRLAGCWRAG